MEAQNVCSTNNPEKSFRENRLNQLEQVFTWFLSWHRCKMTSWCFKVEEDGNEKCVFLIIDDVEQGKVDEIEDKGDSLLVSIFRKIDLNWISPVETAM